MDAVFYWDMTYGEINAAINAYSKNREVELREKAVIAYHQANQIGHIVGIMVGSKQSEKAIFEAYPGFFPDLEQKALQEQAKAENQQQHWRIMKERIEAYAAEKRKRGERRGNNTGRITNTDNVGDIGAT